MQMEKMCVKKSENDHKTEKLTNEIIQEYWYCKVKPETRSRRAMISVTGQRTAVPAVSSQNLVAFINIGIKLNSPRVVSGKSEFETLVCTFYLRVTKTED